VDVAVVGAGLVGLASAYRIIEAAPGLRVAVVEKELGPARHQSGHNSGVVHAGLYYAPGSLKAQLCREGAAALREYCAARDVPLVTRGKLIIAADESELPRLGELKRRGLENGLQGLEELDDWRDIEPHVHGVRALHVPETGVVDYRVVAGRLVDDLRARGVELRFGARVEGFSGSRLRTSAGDLTAGALVACAGLQADRLAGSTDIRIVPFRGDYWRLRGRAAELVRGLVYPVPDPAFPFLGVHFTCGVGGEVTAGPNAVPALAREGYGRASVSLRDAAGTLAWPGFRRLARRYARTGALELWRDVVKRAAVAEMQRYLPALLPSDVERAGCGVRAQAMTRSGELVDDFRVDEGDRSLHVLNAPSPGATSCLAVGRLIAERALELVP
jgi:L-2-hydroxyglutarate oxidase